MRRSLTCIVALSLFLGCDGDNEPDPGPGPGQGAVEAVIVGRLTVQDNIAGNVSRAVNDRWDAGDAIGIFVTGDKTETNRHYLTLNGDDSFTPFADTEKIYLPGEGQSFDLFAYHPYDEKITGETYLINVSDQTNQKALDFITSTKLTVSEDSSPSLLLGFDHRLTKLEFTISPGVGIPEEVMAGLQLSIDGVPLKATADIATGVVIPEADRGQLDMKIDSGGLFAQAVVIPIGAETGRRLAFTLPDQVTPILYDASAWVFKPGERHIYQVEINENREVVIKGQGIINNWSDVDDDAKAH